MRSLSLSDLNRRPGEVVDMALAAPLALTKHGRRLVVILSAEVYDSLVSSASKTTAQIDSGARVEKPRSDFLKRQAAKAAAAELD